MSPLPRAFWGLAAGCSVLLAACVGAGDVTVVNDQDQLRPSEIQEVLSALTEAFGTVELDTSAVPRAAGLQLAPVPVSTTFEATVPCEGGSINISGSANGTLDDETLEGNLTIQFSWSLIGCVLASDYGAITLNGNPSIQFAAEYLIGQEQFSVTASESGGFDFATADGRSGMCAIDVSISLSQSSISGESSQSVVGSVCGRSAEEFAAFLL